MFVIILSFFSYIYISHGSVEMVGYKIIILLRIVRRVCQSKNFENRSIIADMDTSKVPHFYGPRCILVKSVTGYTTNRLL